MNRRSHVGAIALLVAVARIAGPALAGFAPGAAKEKDQHGGPACVCFKDRVDSDQPGRAHNRCVGAAGRRPGSRDGAMLIQRSAR